MMFKLRVQKILLILSTFFVLGLVVIYQLSYYSETKNVSIRDSVSINDRSLKEAFDSRTIKVDIGFKKKSFFEPWSKSVSVYSEG